MQRRIGFVMHPDNIMEMAGILESKSRCENAIPSTIDIAGKHSSLDPQSCKVIAYYSTLRNLLVTMCRLFGCSLAQRVCYLFSVCLSPPFLRSCLPSGAMINVALSAGLGAYVAALDYQAFEPQHEQPSQSVAMRKAGLRVLRECIVEAYLRGAQAAGWPEHYYIRKDVFHECLNAHCSRLSSMVHMQLIHAFILRVRDGRLPGMPAAFEPKPVAYIE